MPREDALDILLQLAKSAIEAENSPMWKRDIELAAQIHSEKCDALWAELKNQIAASEGSGINLACYPTRSEIEKEWRKEFVASLRKVLPDLIDQAIGE